MSDAELLEDARAAQAVVDAASAVQGMRIARYACRGQVQDGSGRWVDRDFGV